MSREVLYTDHHDLDSTALSDVWYDNIEWHLFVRFHSGAVAGYSNVPESIYEFFVDAPSVGRFYNESIIGKFDGLDAKDIEFVSRTAQETVVQDDGDAEVDSIILNTVVSHDRPGQEWTEVVGPRLWDDKGDGIAVTNVTIREYEDPDNLLGDGLISVEADNALIVNTYGNLQASNFAFSTTKDAPEYEYTIKVTVVATDEDSALAALANGEYRVKSATVHYE